MGKGVIEHRENSTQVTEHGPVQWINGQIEEGEETKKEHVQFFIRFKSAKTFSAVKKWFVDLDGWHWIHIKPADGNNAELIRYCSKDETYVRGRFSVGKKPEQGKRSDLHRVATEVKDGASLRDVAVAHPSTFVRNYRGLTSLRNLVHGPSVQERRIFYLGGGTGTGKSHRAHAYDPNAYWWDGGKWWDGYDDHKTVVWDEVDFTTHPTEFLLRLFDKWPQRLAIKGGYVARNWTVMIITSNLTWEQNTQHMMDQVHYQAMARRVPAERRYWVESIDDIIEFA